MSMLVSFVLSFFPQDVLDEILNLIGSVSEGFPSYSCQETVTLKFQDIILGICIKNIHIQTLVNCRNKEMLKSLRVKGFKVKLLKIHCDRKL